MPRVPASPARRNQRFQGWSASRFTRALTLALRLQAPVNNVSLECAETRQRRRLPTPSPMDRLLPANCVRPLLAPGVGVHADGAAEGRGARTSTLVPMGTALIAAAASVLAVLVSVVGTVINSRNDRALTHQEVDLLTKLQPDSKAARELHAVIEARINSWYGRAYKTRRGRRAGGPKQLVARSNSWLWPILVSFGLLYFTFGLMYFLLVLIDPVALKAVLDAIIRNITS